MIFFLNTRGEILTGWSLLNRRFSVWLASNSSDQNLPAFWADCYIRNALVFHYKSHKSWVVLKCAKELHKLKHNYNYVKAIPHICINNVIFFYLWEKWSIINNILQYAFPSRNDKNTYTFYMIFLTLNLFFGGMVFTQSKMLHRYYLCFFNKMSNLF